MKKRCLLSESEQPNPMIKLKNKMTDLSLQNPRHIIPDPLPTSPSKKGKAVHSARKPGGPQDWSQLATATGRKKGVVMISKKPVAQELAFSFCPIIVGQ
jgi:hypothetical protein